LPWLAFVAPLGGVTDHFTIRLFFGFSSFFICFLIILDAFLSFSSIMSSEIRPVFQATPFPEDT
jgi:hypothetical protein